VATLLVVLVRGEASLYRVAWLFMRVGFLAALQCYMLRLVRDKDIGRFVVAAGLRLVAVAGWGVSLLGLVS